ncbi:MAG TPA: aspartate ammonia-lyase, partial [Xanthomonadales bacterium]|nr:aspartate ammonia-lyase [Xanthomonadales bacterium]
PVIAYNLLQSIELLSTTCTLLADKAITTLRVRSENLEKHLGHNPILVTALNPIVGYNKAAEIAKQAYRQQRPVLDVAEELTDLSRNELEALLDPSKLV